MHYYLTIILLVIASFCDNNADQKGTGQQVDNPPEMPKQYARVMKSQAYVATSNKYKKWYALCFNNDTSGILVAVQATLNEEGHFKEVATAHPFILNSKTSDITSIYGNVNFDASEDKIIMKDKLDQNDHTMFTFIAIDSETPCHNKFGLNQD